MRVLVVFGTRPEAIKMAPVIQALKARAGVDVNTAVTGQHREMLDQVLSVFNITPDFDLDVMKKGQDLFDITSRVLLGMRTVLDDFRPDLVLVHGDTTTSTSAALASFYKSIPVGHVEAGLRTYDLKAPFPEEANRQLTSRLARWHYAPTTLNKRNLTQEGVESNNILITGNTVIDALLWVTNTVQSSASFKSEVEAELKSAGLASSVLNKRFILVTGHRRENFGAGFENICKSILHLSEKFPDINFVYPVHLNPRVSEIVTSMLSGKSNIFLIQPLSYVPFVWLLKKCFFVMTDSGGVQEEGPSLGKPVLVMRETTERPEAVSAGTVTLVGTHLAKIVAAAEELITCEEKYLMMSRSHNPYGDGTAAEIISDHILALYADAGDN